METVTTLFDSDLAEWEYMQEQQKKENENKKVGAK